MHDLLSGKLVRFTSESPEALAMVDSAWRRDSELHRLWDSDPAAMRSEATLKRWRTRQFIENGPDDGYSFFSVRTLSGNEHIGDAMLRVNWPNRDAVLGMGIGDRTHWGRGFGTDALNLLLAFAFAELNLRRVTLGVFAYNRRAVRLYERAGFQMEGVMRGEVRREGQHLDGLYMGLLREEWRAMAAI